MNFIDENPSRRIPFIPMHTPEFEPMQYYYCESFSSTRTITRHAFLQLLKEQPFPMAQVNIDLDGGIVYLFPYSPEYADTFIQLNRETEAAYKRFQRDTRAITTGKRQSNLYLDQETSDDGRTLIDTLAAEGTPETICMSKERYASHHAAFNALSESDRDILIGYFQSGYNARALARQLGKDPSGVAKHIKRAAARLQKIIEENS